MFGREDELDYDGEYGYPYRRIHWRIIGNTLQCRPENIPDEEEEEDDPTDNDLEATLIENWTEILIIDTEDQLETSDE